MRLNRTDIERLFAHVSPGGPENAVGFVMWRVSRQYLRALDRSLASLGLTHLKFHTLTLIAWLSATEDAITQIRLSEFSDIQPMQVSLVLRALEEAGLITRARATADSRAKTMELTSSGWQALQKALPVAVEEQERFFGPDARPEGELLHRLFHLDQSRQPNSAQIADPGPA